MSTKTTKPPGDSPEYMIKIHAENSPGRFLGTYLTLITSCLLLFAIVALVRFVATTPIFS